MSIRLLLTALPAFAIVSSSLASSWSARIISSQNLSGVAFPSTDHGWVVGNSGTVLASTDGGQTWVSQSSGTTADLLAVDFVDTVHGWAVGANDTLLSTTDGGATWVKSSTNTGANLESVKFVDVNNGWVVGAKPFPTFSNVITHTTDGGASWVEQQAPVGIGLLAVSFADAQRGFVVGNTEAAYRTEDGGQTWIAVAINGNAAGNAAIESFYAVRRINSTLGVIAGFNGNIYRTQDGGLTWSVVATTGKSIRGLAIAGPSGFAVGVQGSVARSEDLGASWDVEVSGTLYDLNAIAALSSTSAIGVGNAGRLVEFRAGATVPLPLDLSLPAESCQNLTIAWRHGAAGAQDAALTADIDSDGIVEIVIGGPAGVRALRPFTPNEQAVVWTLPFSARVQQLALAELDGDVGTKEIVAATAGSGISHDGVLAIQGATGTILWSRRIAGGSRHVQIADFNGDSFDDVVSIGDGQTLSWLSGRDGSDLYPVRGLNTIAYDLQVADLNGDGVPDVVVALADGRLLALNGTTGDVLWVYQIAPKEQGLQAVAVSDLNGDGTPDIVVVGDGTPSSLIPGNGDCGSITIGTFSGALVAAVNGKDGTLLWDYAEPGVEVFRTVALADITHDGVPDVITHGDNFDVGHLVALDGRGKVVGGVSTQNAQTLWQLNTTRGSSGQYAFTPRSLVAGDGNGDGTSDVYLGLYDGHLIAVSGSVPASGGSATCAAAATELWEASRTAPIYYNSFVTINNRPFVLAVAGNELVVLRDPATGIPIWSYDLGGAPSIATGHLDTTGLAETGVGTASGRIYAIGKDGTALSLSDNFLPQKIVASVAATAGGIDELVGASVDGTLRAVHGPTGQTIWEKALGFVPTSMAAGFGLVIVGGDSGQIVALDAQTGSQQWQASASSRIGAIAYLASANLFVTGDLNGDVRFFNASGQLQTTFPTGPGGVRKMAVVNVDGNAIDQIAAAAGFSFFVLRSDGSLVWRYDIMDFAVGISGVDLDGDGAQEVVASAYGGTVYAVGGSGNLLWTVDNPGGSGGLAAMDIDGDGKQEALIGSPSPYFPLGTGTLKAVRADGTIAASCILNKSPGAISVADYDGDGVNEAAVAMEEGDVYLFKGSAPVPPPVQLSRVVSRKVHGSAGTFDIDVTSGNSIECRSGGASGDYTLVLTFGNPLAGVSGAGVTSGTGSVSASNVDPNDTHNYIVNLTGVANAQTISVSLTNVSDSGGEFSATVPVSMGVLLGDVNGSRRVDAADVSSVRQQTLQFVTGSNFRNDINTTGRIDAADVSIARQQTLTSLP